MIVLGFVNVMDAKCIKVFLCVICNKWCYMHKARVPIRNRDLQIFHCAYSIVCILLNRLLHDLMHYFYSLSQYYCMSGFAVCKYFPYKLKNDSLSC